MLGRPCVQTNVYMTKRFKTKFRDFAKHIPYCMRCGLENPNGDLLCLAHSNDYKHGRGVFYKSKDLFGAYLCLNCHDLIDARTGKLSKEERKKEMEKAWIKTITYLINNDLLDLKNN